MAPSQVNDVMRQIMADVRAHAEDGGWLDWGHTPTYVATDKFSVPGDQTAAYTVGRRVRITDSGTKYGTITAASYTSLTTVTIELDSGTLSSPSAVALGVHNEAVNTPTATDTEAGLVEKATTEEMTNGTVNKFPDAATIKTFVESAEVVDQIARDNLMTLGFQVLVNGNLALQNLANGFIDEFEDETGVDAGGSSGQLYSNGVYRNSSASWTLEQLTTSGNYMSASKMAQSFEVATTDPIIKVKINAQQAGTVDIKLETDSSNTPSGALVSASAKKDGVVLTTGWNEIELDAGFTPVASTKYWLTATRTVGSAQWGINSSSTIANHGYWQTGGGATGDAMFGIYQSTVNASMTLLSEAVTATAAPAEIRTLLRQKDVDSVTLNTDLTLEVSRDGGTTWTAATLSENTTIGDTRVLLGDVDVSGQPSGTSLKYRVKALNSKAQEIHGISQQWSF
ncbi:hypothetical protein [Kiloniella litopenaei]|uniref:hypothetical protein n=1 Tax=Kiloniella litopenaei TaxID=1549748 RepID=UPI003BA8F4F9